MAVIYIGESEGSTRAISVDPYKLEWGLMDVSSDEAGRAMDEGALMYKERICQKRKLKLAWREVTDAQASENLKAVNPEYFYARYWDPMDGEWQTRCFYVGDRSAPFRWFQVLGGTRYSELSFDLIER